MKSLRSSDAVIIAITSFWLMNAIINLFALNFYSQAAIYPLPQDRGIADSGNEIKNENDTGNGNDNGNGDCDGDGDGNGDGNGNGNGNSNGNDNDYLKT